LLQPSRVQALSGADEIVVTDDVLSLPDAADVAVHSLRGAQSARSRLEARGEVVQVAADRVHGGERDVNLFGNRL
jgi:hypothetical protein